MPICQIKYGHKLLTEDYKQIYGHPGNFRKYICQQAFFLSLNAIIGPLVSQIVYSLTLVNVSS